MASVWGVFHEQDDSYDVGSHDELIDVFATEESARTVAALLDGAIVPWSTATRLRGVGVQELIIR